MVEAKRLASYRTTSGVDPWIERQIAERYRILEPLGAGSVGRVYRAQDLESDRQVAIKLIQGGESASGEEGWRRRFEARAAAVAALDHPNIVRLFDFGSAAPGIFFVAMEQLEGQTLESALSGEEPLSFGRQVRIGRELAAALAFAHERGMVHRDLKPSNVMLIPGSQEQVKLLDFGLAGREGESLDPAMSPQGSPAYMAPDQARGESPDPRDDVYSLGVILYEMACGRPPFEAPSSIGVMLMHLDELPKAPRMIDREVPPLLEAAILRALSKDRCERFQTMGAWMAALDEVEVKLAEVESSREAAKAAAKARKKDGVRVRRGFVAMGALTLGLSLLYAGLRVLTP